MASSGWSSLDSERGKGLLRLDPPRFPRLGTLEPWNLGTLEPRDEPPKNLMTCQLGFRAPAAGGRGRRGGSDPHARQVLRRRFPGVRLEPDVAALAALPEETEVLAAGFPCVDVSRAGLRAGLAGSGSGLVRHVFRLLRGAARAGRPVGASRPRWSA